MPRKTHPIQTDPEYIIISLCDASGTWSEPYRKDPRFKVIQVDPHFIFTMIDSNCHMKWSGTVQKFENHLEELLDLPVLGVLMAPPCTHFSIAGADLWGHKDKVGDTQKGLDIIDTCLRIVEKTSPKWWVLENPPGRLEGLRREKIGNAKLYFQPWEYAGWSNHPEDENYTKRTGLWGNFNTKLEKNPTIDPVNVSKTKKWNLNRSITPSGFAKAFYKSNSTITR